ncbi:hypothetical protein E4U59_001015 [Claviceps monticola]|nr:hypothetical protein E4U59_001015 [Claviceps monticola]
MAAALAPVPAPAPVFAPAPVPVLVRAKHATVDDSGLCPPVEHEETEVVAPEPIEDERPTFEAVDVSCAATEPAPAPVHAMVEISELCFADEHEKAQVAPVERVEDLCPIFEAVDVSHAAVEFGVKPFPPQHDEHEDAGVAGCRSTVEDVAVEDVAVEDVAVGDVTAEDVTAEDVIVDAAVDGAAAEDVTVEDATTIKDVTDMLGEDEISLPQPVSLVREKTVKENARVLSEIWGCSGIGPVILKGLVAVLMEPWMIDREVPTQVRKLSRIIIPKKRLRKKSLPFSGAAALSLVNLPMLMGWLRF